MKKILLADDSVTIQKVVELTFMDEDFEVETVGNGSEAISRLTATAPDLVITDIHMPGATGYEVCKRAKELHPGLPVLLLVGTFEVFDAAESESAGADGHLKKPFDSQELLRRVRELVSGAPATVDLGLLRDLDAVTVAITYGNGSRRQVKVFLQRDVREDRLAIQPLQFSQEGELGGTVTYDLELELYSGANDTYRLAVANLPPEIHGSFSDPASSARLRQIHFDGTAGTRRARLALELPDRPSAELALGKARELFVLAVPADREAAIGDLETRSWTTSSLAAAGVSFARLELVPRGVGKLRVDAPQLFHRVEGGQPVRVVIDLKNDGSGELRNVEPRLDTPLGWTRSVEPPLLPSLGVGEERRLTLTLTPPPDVAPGRYETRIESQALADGKPVDGDDKVVTIEIAAPVNLFGTALLIVLILAAIGGLVAFGIKLTRR
jgi:CheY-like chemotaxis protein